MRNVLLQTVVLFALQAHCCAWVWCWTPLCSGPSGRMAGPSRSRSTRSAGSIPRTSLPLVPVAVNVFGGVGEEAATYFNSVELVAKQRKRPYRPAPGGPRTLTELTALLTILTAADIVVASHSRRRAVGDHDPAPALLTCDTCGKLRTEVGLPITCRKCLEGRSYRRRHLNGRACAEARCTEDCPGRCQAAALA